MPTEPNYVAQGTASNTSTPVDVVERAAPDITTTTTADPGAGGTTLAVTSGGERFPQSGTFKVRVEDEVMFVTAGAGTTSWTVQRGKDGTTAVAHSSGVRVALVVGVQRVEPVNASNQVSYKGRIATFRIPGRAGTAGQKIFSLHNATASAVLVDLHKVTVDLSVTAVKAVTVLPPLIRLWKVTVLPTNGTAATKVSMDSALSSNASVTVLQDASADGTSSASALTATLPAGAIVTQEFAARLITAAGFEPMDRAEFLAGDDEIITLRPLEGVVVFLDYVLATQNPITDMWAVTASWTEFTAA